MTLGISDQNGLNSSLALPSGGSLKPEQPLVETLCGLVSPGTRVSPSRSRQIGWKESSLDRVKKKALEDQQCAN